MLLIKKYHVIFSGTAHCGQTLQEMVMFFFVDLFPDSDQTSCVKTLCQLQTNELVAAENEPVWHYSCPKARTVYSSSEAPGGGAAWSYLLLAASQHLPDLCPTTLLSLSGSEERLCSELSHAADGAALCLKQTEASNNNHKC